MNYAPGLDKITDADIAKAAAIDDLDAAALSLQQIAGIDDGGVAAHCFSGFDWPSADRDEREQQIREWLRTEAMYAEPEDGEADATARPQ